MLTYTDSTEMPFGQYKGWKMANIPAEHLLELLERDNAPEAMRNYIMHKYNACDHTDIFYRDDLGKHACKTCRKVLY